MVPYARSSVESGHTWSLPPAGPLPQLPPWLWQSCLNWSATYAHLLRETLGELITLLQLVIDEWDTTTPKTERPASSTFIRHRDWKEAGRAALRAAAAISAVGVVWHFIKISKYFDYS